MINSEMFLQPLTKQDIGLLTALESQAFNGQGEDIFTLRMVQEIGWVYTAMNSQLPKLLGAVELLQTKEPGLGFIHGILVEPECQYHGIGAELLKYVEEEAREIGLNRLSCTISPTNGASLNIFINKSGYQATKFEWDYYGQNEHRLWVEKQLTTAQSNNMEQYFGELIKSKTISHDFLSVLDDDYSGLDEALNLNNGRLVSLVRPKYSGFNSNCLIVNIKP